VEGYTYTKCYTGILMNYNSANAQRTGANDGSLANPRRWGGGGSSGGGGGGGGYNDNNNNYGPPSSGYGQQQSSYGGQQQGGYGQQSYAPPPPQQQQDSSALVGPPGERKRKSRWGDEKDKIQVAGLPTAISGNVQGRDLENYAIHVRLEEIARKLRSGDVIPPERERSPSPPPTYDHHGRRTNTRDIRYKRKLEDERNKLVEKAMRSDPSYKPPTEYLMHKRLSGRPSEKIYIPVKEFPEIKWIGLILGPRGNSLKQMEKETGAKIVIRGKGSTKEGKGQFGNRSADEEDELHCNITADSHDKVEACAKLINKVIATVSVTPSILFSDWCYPSEPMFSSQAASTPDEQNDHKRNQLRELAMLNGTLRDDENQPCQNCGKLGHRKYDCPEQRNFTASIVCRNCGNMGHMARDCIAHRKGGAAGGPATTPAFDSEYSALMAELGEGPASASGGGLLNGPQGNADPYAGAFGSDMNNGHGGAQAAPAKALPPWRIPTNWHPPQPAGGRDGDRFGRGGGGPQGMNYNPYGSYGQSSYAAAYGDQAAAASGRGGYDYSASSYYGGAAGGAAQSAYGTAGYGAAYA
jgi:splicing factor 1